MVWTETSRNNDDAGLGDWVVNKEKLPNGLGWLVKQCTDNDIKFGIWVEPEMVNPKVNYSKNILTG